MLQILLLHAHAASTVLSTTTAHRKLEKSAQHDIYLSTRLDDRQVDDGNGSEGTI